MASVPKTEQNRSGGAAPESTTLDTLVRDEVCADIPSVCQQLCLPRFTDRGCDRLRTWAEPRRQVWAPEVLWGHLHTDGLSSPGT